MTQLDVLYRFGLVPTETTMRAMGRVREVYGVRHVSFDDAAKTVRVEYDATRLTEPVIHNLLRRTGLDIQERIALSTKPVPAAATAVVA